MKENIVQYSIDSWYDKNEKAWALVVKDQNNVRITPIFWASTFFIRNKIEEDLKNEYRIYNS